VRRPASFSASAEPTNARHLDARRHVRHFGGYKDSGVGHQNVVDAILEYMQTKSAWVELPDEVQDPFILRV
jgi:hypothetical protein